MINSQNSGMFTESVRTDRSRPISQAVIPSTWFAISLSPRTIWCLAFIPHTIAITFSCVSILGGHGTGNLPDFLAAASNMLQAKDIYASGTGGYVYPPLIAFLYQPLAMMPLRTAALVSLSINAAVSLITLVLISHVTVNRLVGSIDSRLIASVALFGAICTADKIKGEFAHLETNVFMLLAFTLAMKWVDRRPWLCGLALGFAFNIKYMPLVLVPFLLLRRRYIAVLWFAIWAMAFAMLPALSMGWRGNLDAWAQASGGLFNLFGYHSQHAHIAHLRKITDFVSISITSGLARTTKLSGPWPLLLAAGIGAVFCLVVATGYRKNQIPILAWPKIQRQAKSPFKGMLSIEWISMLLLTLIFSPFTNSRHLYMLLDVNIAAVTLLLGTRGLVRRTPLLIATVCMAVGISCPPGGVHAVEPADQFWRNIGGPAWCMLGLIVVLNWTNACFQEKSVQSKQITS